jgi:hypothetical protein
MIGSHRRLLARCALLAAVAISGCYRSYGLSDEAVIDGSVPDAAWRDSGHLEGGYWRLEPRAARVSFRNALGCMVYAGGTLAATVTVQLTSTCEHAAPLDVERHADGTHYVHAMVWAEHRPADAPVPCAPVSTSEARTYVFPAEAGEVRVVDGYSLHEARIMVADTPDGVTCVSPGGPDAPCRMDCDCAGGLRCLAALGDAVPCAGGRCGEPCDGLGSLLGSLYDRDLGCSSGEACVDAGLASLVCGPRTRGCTPGDCGEGLECPVATSLSRCEWSVPLSSAIRHTCADDRDCDPGLHCVVRGDGALRCEVPCLSATMACPPGNACQGAASSWVCDWLPD